MASRRVKGIERKALIRPIRKKVNEGLFGE
jgi:hypothetical protein